MPFLDGPGGRSRFGFLGRRGLRILLNRFFYIRRHLFGEDYRRQKQQEKNYPGNQSPFFKRHLNYIIVVTA